MSMDDCNCGDCQDVLDETCRVSRTDDGMRIEPLGWCMTQDGPCAVGGLSMAEIRKISAPESPPRHAESPLCDMMNAFRKRCVEVVGECSNSFSLRCSRYSDSLPDPKFEWTFSYKRKCDCHFHVINAATLGVLLGELNRFISNERRFRPHLDYDVISLGG